jgi:hypothetical protein
MQDEELLPNLFSLNHFVSVFLGNCGMLDIVMELYTIYNARIILNSLIGNNIKNNYDEGSCTLHCA